jgi:threonine/homoserine/homoserine lactone efflux protein
MIQLAVVAAGLSWIVDLFARYFDAIRFVGAAYLLLLGIQTLWRARKTAPPQQPLSAERAFARGFAVAFANPKTLIFQAAFLPQFLSNGESRQAQLWLLAATFWVITVIGDAIWVLCASRLKAAVSGRAQLIADRVSGGILIAGAGVLLAASRR